MPDNMTRLKDRVASNYNRILKGEEWRKVSMLNCGEFDINLLARNNSIPHSICISLTLFLSLSLSLYLSIHLFSCIYVYVCLSLFLLLSLSLSLAFSCSLALFTLCLLSSCSLNSGSPSLSPLFSRYLCSVSLFFSLIIFSLFTLFLFFSRYRYFFSLCFALFLLYLSDSLSRFLS